MKFIAERAQQQANDSLQTIQPDNNRNTVDSTMIQQSIQRDDSDDGLPAVNEMTKQPAVQNMQPVLNNIKPAAVKKEIKPILKPVQKTAPATKDAKQPKAVMQNKNEYAPKP